MTYNKTGRYGGFFRVLRYNVGGYGIPPTQNLSSGCVGGVSKLPYSKKITKP